MANLTEQAASAERSMAPSDEHSDVATRTITYRDLLAEHLKQVASLKTRWNIKGTLDDFRRILGLSEDDSIIPSMTIEYTANRDKVVQALSRTGSKNTLPAIKSRLKKLNETATRMALDDGLPAPFAEALKFAVRQSGMTSVQVAKAVGLNKVTFADWVAERTHPDLRRHKVDAFGKLEKLLGLRPGALQGRLRYRKMKYVRHSGERFIRLRNKLVYRTDFPPQVESVWMEYRAFKTGTTPGVNPSTGKLMNRGKSARWKVRQDRTCCSADAFHVQMLGFYGWLRLPSDEARAAKLVDICMAGENLTDEERRKLVPMMMGKGMTDNELHFFQLSDPALLSEYINFLTVRANGTEGGAQRSVVARSLSLVTNNGFVTQRIDLAYPYMNWGPFNLRHNGFQARRQEWAEFCNERWTTLCSIQNGLAKHSKNRDPEARIAPILALSNPLDAIIEIILNHHNDKPASSEKQMLLAEWYRDQFMLRLEMFNPLRNRNLRSMIYRADNTGNLYQRDGEWRIRFKPEEFKNEKGAAKKPYDVALAPSVQKWATDYITRWRRELLALGKKPTDVVFVTRRGGGYSGHTISDRFLSLTSHYLRSIETPGFRTHALRHIVATAWLRANPNDFATVADVLHDDILTVLRNYAHLKVEHGLKRYSDWLDTKLKGQI